MIRRETYRSFEHGVAGLEAIGAFLPEKATIVRACGDDVTPNLVPTFRQNEAHLWVLCYQCLCDRVGMFGNATRRLLLQLRSVSSSNAECSRRMERVVAGG